MDNKILAKVLKQYKEKLIEKEKLHNNRILEINSNIPKIIELQTHLRANLSSTALLAFIDNKDIEKSLKKLETENKKLRNEKKDLLINAGYPADFLDFPYDCIACCDTGYIGTHICECTKVCYEHMRVLHITNMLDTRHQNFDTFDINKFSNDSIPGSNVSHRDNMRIILDNALRFCDEFPKSNLILTGSSGLGKTFLSSCIADKISKKGFSVIYKSATDIFNVFETEKFKNSGDSSVYFDTDLLIIDDLGTEMTTSFTISVLYNIINTRLLSSRPTIINTNIPPYELENKYTGAIASRLNGEYKLLSFFGYDLRKNNY